MELQVLYAEAQALQVGDFRSALSYVMGIGFKLMFIESQCLIDVLLSLIDRSIVALNSDPTDSLKRRTQVLNS